MSLSPVVFKLPVTPPAMTQGRRSAAPDSVSDPSAEERPPAQEQQARPSAMPPEAPVSIVPRPIGGLGIVQWLGSLVNQCHYGKNLTELLSPEKQFEVTSTDGNLWLKNYAERPRDLPPFQGVCNDLTYTLGTFLQRLIGTEYTIQPVRGQCDDFYSHGTHIYLLLWPRSADGHMQQQLAHCHGKVPDGCYLVDPSFHRLLPPMQEKPQRGRYRLQQEISLENINPTTLNKDLYMSSDDTPTWFPLGYVKELMPEMNNGRGLLFFGFQKAGSPDEMPSLDFMIMPTTDDRLQEHAAHWVMQLPAHHPLQQFRSKIKQDLSTAQFQQWFPFLQADDTSFFLDLPELPLNENPAATNDMMEIDEISPEPLSPSQDPGMARSQSFNDWLKQIADQISWNTEASPVKSQLSSSTSSLKSPFALPTKLSK